MQFTFKESYENKEATIEYTVFGVKKYGIEARDGVEAVRSPELFFTRAEALKWCEFMTLNKVLPSSLNDVLSDEFYIHKIPQSSF